MSETQTDKFKALEELCDEELTEIHRKAEELISAREAARKKEALKEIRRIAKEHDLEISARRKRRKSDQPLRRPKKTESA